MKTTITSDDFLRVEGLLTLAHDHRRSLQSIERSLATLLNAKNDGYDYYGHVSDAVYEFGVRAHELLERMELEVEE